MCYLRITIESNGLRATITGFTRSVNTGSVSRQIPRWFPTGLSLRPCSQLIRAIYLRGRK